jgi:hypothetical protein
MVLSKTNTNVTAERNEHVGCSQYYRIVIGMIIKLENKRSIIILIKCDVPRKLFIKEANEVIFTCRHT